MPNTILGPDLDPGLAANRTRWALAARGMLALVTGLWLLAAPLGGLVTLLAVIAMLLAVDGVVAALVALWRYGDGEIWWIEAAQAVASLVLATLALGLPALSLLALLWLVAAWALWQGVCEVLLARLGGGGRWLELGGVVSVVLALVMVAMPVIGGLSLVTVMALYAVVRGVYLLAAAVRAYSSASRKISP